MFRLSTFLNLSLVGLLLMIHSYGWGQKVYDPDRITYESLHELPLEDLVQRVETLLNDTLRARTYGYIAYRYSYRDTEQELHFLDKSLELSKRINYKRGIGIVKNNLAGIYGEQGDNNQAIKAYSEALEIAEEIKDSSFMVVCLMNIGHQLEKRQKLDEALSTLERAESICNLLENPHPVALSGTYKYMGAVFRKQKDYDAAIGYLSKALEVIEDLPNTMDQLFVRINLAFCYFEKEEYPKMMSYVQEVEELNAEVQSAKISVIYHYLMGRYHLFVEKDFPSSETHLLAGLKLAEEIGDLEFQGDYLGVLTKVYKAEGKYEKALDKAEAYELIQSTRLKIEQDNTFEEMEARYKAKEKEAEIALLQKERLIQRAQIIQNQTITLTTLVGAAILLLGMWLFFRQRVKTYRLNSQLAEQAERLSQQELDAVHRDMTIKLMKSNLDGQMLERTRVAKDLHDSLGGLLASIKLKASAITDMEEVAPVVTAIDQACREVRSISHSLHPVKFEEFDFPFLLSEMVENFNAHQHTLVNLDIHGASSLEDLSLQQKSELYRIVQELLYNAHKHAEAEHINLSFTSHDDYLSVVLEDDGKGFDPTKIAQGLGLKNIKTRIHNLGGSWHLDSRPGCGTIAQMDIPLNPFPGPMENPSP